MTYKEKYLSEHPEVKNWRSEVQGMLCPHEVGYEPCEEHQIEGCINAMDCESCWNREISKPEEQEDVGLMRGRSVAYDV